MPIMPLSFICLDLLVAGGYPGFKFCYSLKDDSTAPKPRIRFPFKKRVRLDNIKRPTHIAGMFRCHD